jgi:hypothetical protein
VSLFYASTSEKVKSPKCVELEFVCMLDLSKNKMNLKNKEDIQFKMKNDVDKMIKIGLNKYKKRIYGSASFFK